MRTGRTSPATPLGSASSRATPPSCGDRPGPSSPTWPSPTCCARPTPRPTSLPTPSSWWQDTSREAAVEFMRPARHRRLPHPAGRPVAHPLDPGQRHGALRHRRRRQLPRVRRRRRRSRHGPPHHPQRQGAAALGLQRGRDAAGPPRRVVEPFLAAAVVPELQAAGVQLVVDEAAKAACADLITSRSAATEVDWADRVPGPEAGGQGGRCPSTRPSTTSRRHGSGHSEAIVTADLAAADRFTLEVDAAAVLVNASTRFVDGEEFGFGAEIGISTQKLHARGPMGLRELTTAKYVVRPAQARPARRGGTAGLRSFDNPSKEQSSRSRPNGNVNPSSGYRPGRYGPQYPPQTDVVT